jgi:hypothetical protein
MMTDCVMALGRHFADASFSSSTDLGARRRCWADNQRALFDGAWEDDMNLHLGWPGLTLRLEGGAATPGDGVSAGHFGVTLAAPVLNLLAWSGGYPDTNVYAVRVGPQVNIDTRIPTSAPGPDAPATASGVSTSGGGMIEAAIHPHEFNNGVFINASVGGGDRGLRLGAGVEVGLTNIGPFSPLANLRAGVSYTSFAEEGEHIVSLTLSGSVDLSILPAIAAAAIVGGGR